jgi:hypothetical protein
MRTPDTVDGVDGAETTLTATLQVVLPLAHSLLRKVYAESDESLAIQEPADDMDGPLLSLLNSPLPWKTKAATLHRIQTLLVQENTARAAAAEKVRAIIADPPGLTEGESLVDLLRIFQHTSLGKTCALPGPSVTAEAVFGDNLSRHAYLAVCARIVANTANETRIKFNPIVRRMQRKDATDVMWTIALHGLLEPEFDQRSVATGRAQAEAHGWTRHCRGSEFIMSVEANELHVLHDPCREPKGFDAFGQLAAAQPTGMPVHEGRLLRLTPLLLYLIDRVEEKVVGRSIALHQNSAHDRLEWTTLGCHSQGDVSARDRALTDELETLLIAQFGSLVRFNECLAALNYSSVALEVVESRSLRGPVYAEERTSFSIVTGATHRDAGTGAFSTVSAEAFCGKVDLWLAADQGAVNQSERILAARERKAFLGGTHRANRLGAPLTVLRAAVFEHTGSKAFTQEVAATRLTTAIACEVGILVSSDAGKAYWAGCSERRAWTSFTAVNGLHRANFAHVLSEVEGCAVGNLQGNYFKLGALKGKNRFQHQRNYGAGTDAEVLAAIVPAALLQWKKTHEAKDEVTEIDWADFRQIVRSVGGHHGHAVMAVALLQSLLHITRTHRDPEVSSVPCYTDSVNRRKVSLAVLLQSHSLRISDLVSPGNMCATRLYDWLLADAREHMVVHTTLSVAALADRSDAALAQWTHGDQEPVLDVDVARLTAADVSYGQEGAEQRQLTRTAYASFVTDGHLDRSSRFSVISCELDDTLHRSELRGGSLRVRSDLARAVSTAGTVWRFVAQMICEIRLGNFLVFSTSRPYEQTEALDIVIWLSTVLRTGNDALVDAGLLPPLVVGTAANAAFDYALRSGFRMTTVADHARFDWAKVVPLLTSGIFDEGAAARPSAVSLVDSTDVHSVVARLTTTLGSVPVSLQRVGPFCLSSGRLEGHTILLVAGAPGTGKTTLTTGIRQELERNPRNGTVTHACGDMEAIRILDAKARRGEVVNHAERVAILEQGHALARDKARDFLHGDKAGQSHILIIEAPDAVGAALQMIPELGTEAPRHLISITIQAPATLLEYVILVLERTTSEHAMATTVDIPVEQARALLTLVRREGAGAGAGAGEWPSDARIEYGKRSEFMSEEVASLWFGADHATRLAGEHQQGATIGSHHSLSSLLRRLYEGATAEVLPWQCGQRCRSTVGPHQYAETRDVEGTRNRRDFRWVPKSAAQLAGSRHVQRARAGGITRRGAVSLAPLVVPERPQWANGLNWENLHGVVAPGSECVETTGDDDTPDANTCRLGAVFQVPGTPIGPTHEWYRVRHAESTMILYNPLSRTQEDFDSSAGALNGLIRGILAGGGEGGLEASASAPATDKTGRAVVQTETETETENPVTFAGALISHHGQPYMAAVPVVSLSDEGPTAVFRGRQLVLGDYAAGSKWAWQWDAIRLVLAGAVASAEFGDVESIVQDAPLRTVVSRVAIAGITLRQLAALHPTTGKGTRDVHVQPGGLDLYKATVQQGVEWLMSVYRVSSLHTVCVHMRHFMRPGDKSRDTPMSGSEFYDPTTPLHLVLGLTPLAKLYLPLTFAPDDVVYLSTPREVLQKERLTRLLDKGVLEEWQATPFSSWPDVDTEKAARRATIAAAQDAVDTAVKKLATPPERLRPDATGQAAYATLWSESKRQAEVALAQVKTANSQPGAVEQQWSAARAVHKGQIAAKWRRAHTPSTVASVLLLCNLMPFRR